MRALADGIKMSLSPSERNGVKKREENLGLSPKFGIPVTMGLENVIHCFQKCVCFKEASTNEVQTEHLFLDIQCNGYNRCLTNIRGVPMYS